VRQTARDAFTHAARLKPVIGGDRHLTDKNGIVNTGEGADRRCHFPKGHYTAARAHFIGITLL